MYISGGGGDYLSTVNEFGVSIVMFNGSTTVGVSFQRMASSACEWAHVYVYVCVKYVYTVSICLICTHVASADCLVRLCVSARVRVWMCDFMVYICVSMYVYMSSMGMCDCRKRASSVCVHEHVYMYMYMYTCMYA